MQTRHFPRRRFGQHFLHDPHVVRRILDAVDPRPGERVVEIGPGLGVLTDPLLARVGTLDAVELDRDLAARLAARHAATPALRVHAGDALRFEFRSLAGPGERLRVVGNLPYNVSTPLIFHLLGAREAIDDMHFMLQREIVERIVAPPGSPGYGRLSVMVRIACEARKLFTVAAGAFRPPPRVTSAFLRLRVHRDPPVPVTDVPAFERVVTAAFGQRRKTLRNALGTLLTADRIRGAGIDPGARPQDLDLADFAALAGQLAGAAAPE